MENDNLADGLKILEIKEIELKKINDSSVENRWYYLVQWHENGECREKMKYSALLLNGKLVSALIEPESIK